MRDKHINIRVVGYVHQVSRQSHFYGITNYITYWLEGSNEHGEADGAVHGGVF